MEEMKSEIINALESKASLALLLHIVKKYKDLKYSKSEVYSNLEEMRSIVSIEQEDTLLDLMDFVSGFCNPDQSIW